MMINVSTSNCIIPPYLVAGDKVAIVAPARSINPSDISTAIQILEMWGLEVLLAKHLYSHYHQFAGTDVERTEDMQEALDNTDIKAIICARGGYGTSRIIDKIDFSGFLKSPKWLVGFSDITVLHAHLYKIGVASIHGIMPLLFPKQTHETVESLRQALEGKPINIAVAPHYLNKQGHAKGDLIGGNLSLFANIIGTASEVNTEGKILFLEDVSEYLYHLDRMMVQLLRAGKLANLAGMVVGQFSEIRDTNNAFGKNINELILDLVQEFNYPIAFDFPIGHEQHNLSIFCGKTASLVVEANKVWLKQD